MQGHLSESSSPRAAILKSSASAYRVFLQFSKSLSDMRRWTGLRTCCDVRGAGCINEAQRRHHKTACIHMLASTCRDLSGLGSATCG